MSRPRIRSGAGIDDAVSGLLLAGTLLLSRAPLLVSRAPATR